MTFLLIKILNKYIQSRLILRRYDRNGGYDEDYSSDEQTNFVRRMKRKFKIVKFKKIKKVTFLGKNHFFGEKLLFV